MWSVLAVAYIIVYVHRVAPSVVADRLMETFAVRDGAVLGGLAAMYFNVYMIMQLPSGLMADSLGPRITVTLGTLFAAIGSFFFAAAPSVFLAFVGRFLVGLGVSVIFVSILKFQSFWFSPREFAFITGLLLLVGNAGAMLAATPLAFLVNSHGWRFSFSLIGAFSLFVALASWAIIRDAPPNVQKKKEDDSFLLRLRENVAQMMMVIRNKDTWPMFFVAVGLYGPLMAFQGMWGVPYLMQVYGMTRIGAANLMLLIGAGMATGSPLLGYASDKLVRRKPFYLVSVVLFTACWVLLVNWGGGKPPLGSLYPLCFLLGFFTGVMTLTFTLGKEVNPPHFAGVSVAVVNIGAFLGISLLQPFLGYLLDLGWDGTFIEGVKVFPVQAYQMAFRFCLSFLVLAVAGAAFSRETRGQNIFSSKK